MLASRATRIRVRRTQPAGTGFPAAGPNFRLYSSMSRLPLLLRALVSGLALLAISLLFQDTSRAHGGSYRGPSSSPPAGGGGGGGSSAADTVPAGGSSTGATPSSGGAATGPSGRGPGSSTGSGGSGPGSPGSITISTETDWSNWWELNKDRYLNLKTRLYGNDIKPGSASFFLGGWPAALSKDSLRPTTDQIRKHVVPALLHALETETHNEIITGCLIALAKSGRTETPAFAKELQLAFLPFLSDSNQEIAETAALSIGILGHDSGVPVLIDLLLETDESRKLVKRNRVHFRTRSFAAYGLSVIGGRSEDPSVRSRIVAALFKTLDTDTSGTKDLRVACMVALGRTPISHALPVQAMKARKDWKPESCRVAEIDHLLAFFESPRADFLVRSHAPTTLVGLLEGIPASIRTPLKSQLATSFISRIRGAVSEPREIVQGCVIALGLLADSDADSIDKRMRKTLLNVDKHIADPLGRRLAAIALGQIGARDGTGAGAGSGRAEIEKALAKGLDGSTLERPWFALAIGVLGRSDNDQRRDPSQELSESLLVALDKAHSPVEVGALAIAVGMIGLEDAQPLLREKLSDLSVDDTRGYLVLAMGLIGRRESISQVQAVVAQSRYRPTLLRQAAVSLGLMGDKRLVPDLVRMMADSNGLATQAATAAALGFIGDSRSIDPLLEMLTDSENYTDTARGFAAVSLGLVADDSDLPWNATFANDINYRATTPTLNDENGAGLLNIL